MFSLRLVKELLLAFMLSDNNMCACVCTMFYMEIPFNFYFLYHSCNYAMDLLLHIPTYHMTQFTNFKKSDGRFKYYSVLIHLIMYALVDDFLGFGMYKSGQRGLGNVWTWVIVVISVTDLLASIINCCVGRTWKTINQFSIFKGCQMDPVYL